MMTNSIPRLIFEFSFFRSQSHPLRFRLLKKKLNGKTPENVLGSLVWCFRAEDGAFSEAKDEEKHSNTIKASIKRSKMPYSVERAEARSTENIVSNAFSARKVER